MIVKLAGNPCFGVVPRDRAQLLAVRQRIGVAQQLAAAVIRHADVQQPRGVQRRKHVERPPGDVLVRVDLREIAASLRRGLFHQGAVPFLADADADVLGARPRPSRTQGVPPRIAGQQLNKLVVTFVAENRHAAAEMDDKGFSFFVTAGMNPAAREEGLFQVECADQVRIFEPGDRLLDVFNARGLRLGRPRPHIRPGGEHRKRIVVLDVRQKRSRHFDLRPGDERIAIGGRFEEDCPMAWSSRAHTAGQASSGTVAEGTVAEGTVAEGIFAKGRLIPQHQILMFRVPRGRKAGHIQLELSLTRVG